MRKPVIGGVLVVCTLTGCTMTTHREIKTDTTVSQKPPSGPPRCATESIVWRGVLDEDKSLLTLCDAPAGYRLIRRYRDKSVTEVSALSTDVGLDNQSSHGGFWLRTDSLYYTVMEGHQTATFEIDQEVPLKGWLPRFVTSVPITGKLHINNTRAYLR